MDDAIFNRARILVGVLEIALAGGKRSRGALGSVELDRAVQDAGCGEFHALKGHGKFVRAGRDGLLAGTPLRGTDGRDEIIRSAAFGWGRGTGIVLILLPREETRHEARHFAMVTLANCREGGLWITAPRPISREGERSAS